MSRISTAVAAFILPIAVFIGVDAHENDNVVVRLPHTLTVPTAAEGLRIALADVSNVSDHGYSAQARCLAQAVYFEARSEPVEGQLAVAQVVLNRVDDRRYPSTVCGVVFQNKRMRNRCQFSFACDGRSDEPFERRAWERAKKISHMATEGLWADVTRHATHYHADYVDPHWSSAMLHTVSHGRHVFYRDR